jgi:ABC-type nitrate/sulfonate/bicarbonate transport system permease component
MAEFLGSGEGVGARIFWAYRRMDMADLLAWTGAIVLLGLGLEYGLAGPLRKRAVRRAGTLADGEDVRAAS